MIKKRKPMLLNEHAILRLHKQVRKASKPLIYGLPEGPWDYRGVIMSPEVGCKTRCKRGYVEYFSAWNAGIPAGCLTLTWS